MENELLAAEIYLHPVKTADATKCLDEQLKNVEARIQDYTVHLSAADYAAAIAGGIFTGAIDAFVVGESDFFNHLSRDQLKSQFEEMLDRAKNLFVEDVPTKGPRIPRAGKESPFADNEFLKAFTIQRNPAGLLAAVLLQLGKGGMIQKDSGGKVRLFPEQNGSPPAVGIVGNMGDHDALARHITVPALTLAVLKDEVFILIQVADDAHGLVGGQLLLVPHGQRVVVARLGLDVVDPAHEDLLVGRIARRREAVVVVATHAHDVPIAHAIMAPGRVIHVGQAQTVAKFVGKHTNAVDCRAIVIVAVQLIEYRKAIDDRVSG